MLGLLLFVLIVSHPVLAGDRVLRADDVNRLETLISTQAAAIQDLQARASASETTISTLQSHINHQDATIRQLQDAANRQEHTVGFLVDFGTLPYHAVQLSTSTPVLFNRVVTNVGGAYDVDTGYFTAPYRGLYLFHLHFMGALHNDGTELSITVGNSDVALAFAKGGNLDKHDQGSCSAVVHLSGGEKVSVKWDNGQTGLWGSYLTSFSGALIHPE